MELFLYSTNTELSYRLGKDYYNGTFFVWCSPVFEPSADRLSPYHKIPRSSSPYDIYKELKADVESGDLHSAKIKENRAGLKKGALEYFKNDIIDEQELTRINYIIENALISDFKPILYIISYDLVKDRLKKVPVDKMANPLSCEYVIEDLKETEFEKIYQF